MTECFAPSLAQVKSILTACELPVDDLGEECDVTFIACGPQSRPVAVAGLEKHAHFGLLRSVAVSSSARGKAYGQRLLAEIENMARGSQLQALYLLTTTAPEFFRRLGYQEVARNIVPEPIRQTSEFASLCPDDAIPMMKLLH